MPRDEAAEQVAWAIEIVRDRWFLLVVHRLLEAPQRQAQLLREIDGISQRMLTRTLRHMERDGLVQRTIVKPKPIHVEYSLTNLGRSLVPLLKQALQWARQHQSEVAEHRGRSQG